MSVTSRRGPSLCILKGFPKNRTGRGELVSSPRTGRRSWETATVTQGFGCLDTCCAPGSRLTGQYLECCPRDCARTEHRFFASLFNIPRGSRPDYRGFVQYRFRKKTAMNWRSRRLEAPEKLTASIESCSLGRGNWVMSQRSFNVPKLSTSRQNLLRSRQWI